MANVIINRDSLDDYTKLQDDVLFTIKVELTIGGSSECRNERIYQLLDHLTDAWGSVYNPILKDISISLRRLYAQYIKAKKAGELEKAETYLKCYLDLKKG